MLQKTNGIKYKIATKKRRDFSFIHNLYALCMWITVDKLCSKFTKERLFVDKFYFFVYNLHKKALKKRKTPYFQKVIHLKAKKNNVLKGLFCKVIHKKYALFSLKRAQSR